MKISENAVLQTVDPNAVKCAVPAEEVARVKGLGGGKKAAKGSSSWEAFIKKNPEREIK